MMPCRIGLPWRLSVALWWCTAVLTTAAAAAALQSPNGYIYASFRPVNDSVTFSHLTVDQVTGRVYVGASNWIFQLGANLEVEAQVATGPRFDSPLCTYSSCSDDKVTKVPTNNINKVLVIDYDSRTMISCGSVYQGACHKLRLDNISHDVEFIDVPVAANDDTSSTYAFIGPEKYLMDQKKVLYVGSTFTNNGPYRDLVPAIASRQLNKLDLAELGFSSQPKVEIDSRWRDYFRVKYKYGFFSETHAYFATVQRKSHLPANEEDGYLTRLARVCINDPKYNTYSEVTLHCTDGVTNFNILQDAVLVSAGTELARSLGIRPRDPVLLTVFAPSVSHTTEAMHFSAMCVYSLQEIEQRFTENIHMCFNGSVRTRNMEYVAGSPGDCPLAGVSSAGNIFNFCDADLKISGTSPISTQATLVYPNVSITAVTATTTEPHTVVFLGTENGHLKKVLLSRATEANEYEEVELDPGNPILPDLQMDITGDFLYVPTPTKVSKVKVENCTRYSNCSSCIGAKDPYCGWCSLERRCTVKATCQNATRFEMGQSPPRWLSLGSQQCIDFESVSPDTIPITDMRLVHLIIHELPQLPAGAKYLCVFGNTPPIEAQVTPNGLLCATPEVTKRPQIPKIQDHKTVYLSVRSSETNTDFVSRTFHYFDCSVHTNCRACTTSNWACSWCVYENKCTNNITVCQHTVISGENNPVHLATHGSLFCPRFRPGSEILLPHEVETEVEVAVEHLAVPQLGQAGYQCILEIEGAKAVVAAKIKGTHSIICGKRAYTYQSPVGELSAKLTVVWNGNHLVDTTEVILYKCPILGSHRGHPDCSLCQTQDSKYRCAWCGNSCNYRDSCLHEPISSCPKPRIDVIRPLSAPIEGGTLVTIEGGNLGLREEEVSDKLFIGAYPCELVEYNVSVRIVCRAGPSEGEYEASVKVGNKAGETVSSERFYYRDVRVAKVSPKLGPQSGGTRLTISGSHLNIGSSVQVYLDDLPCRVDSSLTTSSQLSCLTSRSPTHNYLVSRLTVNIDGANRSLDFPFKYTEDPTITRIYPMESYLSGGRHVMVEGMNLMSVQSPRMVVYYKSRTVNETVCHVINNSLMNCPSPPVNRQEILSWRDRRSLNVQSSELRLHIGFIMDEVQAVMNVAENFPNVRNELIYYEDPVFFPFDRDRIKLYKGDTLVIEGENLRRASDDKDVNVTIGTKPCNVTSLAMSQLVCTPPELQPLGTDEIGRQTEHRLPLVVVRVGENLRFPIGYLRYEVIKHYEFPPEAIGGIAAGGAFLILLSIIILIVYRRKSTQAEREYKRIQIQMDTLESNVRSECKQAFAELQTDMTDLTSDLEATGIPTLDHKNYVMKVFFPGVNEHPILEDPKERSSLSRSNYNAAMVQFEQLLCNKNFLLTFIDTLENQKSFSIRDKVNVASLLMIILMGKMEYATDILKALLLRLIDKSVCTKHPQLMFRRTESVVEKMLSNWMALCMYHYLKDCAGSSLFLLFKAIKHQVEKGPVDFITHDARYSLSEERLLREQIVEHSVVELNVLQTIQVVQEDLDEKVQCKVLDCDTISQVKSKILDALYKNTPHSLRPAVCDVDLEWRHGRGGHLTLQDEDLTSKTVNGWRQLNTLEHYGVKESAVMSLITRQNESFNSNCTGNYSLNSISPIITSNIDIEQGVKVYHLVKPIDDQHYQPNSKERTHKAIPEIFLTRLLSTKGTIQKFVDDFFQTILKANESLPPAVKWLFDTMDEAARRHGISDPEVVHAWKSNSLPLRFWVNFIKNPDFIFDIFKTNTVDSCLSVIAQTFMDSCSTSEHRLGKDSPSNKLLFAKDIPRYREMVVHFYREVQHMPQITDQEMNSAMQQLSMAHQNEFDTISALKELYIYATKYNEPIISALEADSYCNKLHLAHKLENVACTLDGEETSTC